MDKLLPKNNNSMKSIRVIFPCQITKVQGVTDKTMSHLWTPNFWNYSLLYRSDGAGGPVGAPAQEYGKGAGSYFFRRLDAP